MLQPHVSRLQPYVTDLRHTDLVILLVGRGASGDLVDNKGMNVLASAAAFGQVGVINAIGEKLGVGENTPPSPSPSPSP